jgi:hypothetical protein
MRLEGETFGCLQQIVMRLMKSQAGVAYLVSGDQVELCLYYVKIGIVYERLVSRSFVVEGCLRLLELLPDINP